MYLRSFSNLKCRIISVIPATFFVNILQYYNNNIDSTGALIFYFYLRHLKLDTGNDAILFNVNNYL